MMGSLTGPIAALVGPVGRVGAIQNDHSFVVASSRAAIPEPMRRASTLSTRRPLISIKNGATWDARKLDLEHSRLL
jgi:hypothetical protein